MERKDGERQRDCGGEGDGNRAFLSDYVKLVRGAYYACAGYSTTCEYV